MPPSGEEVLTTCPGVPCAIIRGRKACMPWNTPHMLEPMPLAAAVTTAVRPLTSLSIRGLHRVVDLCGVVVALVDVGQDRLRVQVRDDGGALIAGLLAVRDLDELAHREVGDGVEVRVP